MGKKHFYDKLNTDNLLTIFTSSSLWGSHSLRSTESVRSFCSLLFLISHFTCLNSQSHSPSRPAWMGARARTHTHTHTHPLTGKCDNQQNSPRFSWLLMQRSLPQSPFSLPILKWHLILNFPVLLLVQREKRWCREKEDFSWVLFRHVRSSWVGRESSPQIL